MSTAIVIIKNMHFVLSDARGTWLPRQTKPALQCSRYTQ